MAARAGETAHHEATASMQRLMGGESRASIALELGIKAR